MGRVLRCSAGGGGDVDDDGYRESRGGGGGWPSRRAGEDISGDTTGEGRTILRELDGLIPHLSRCSEFYRREKACGHKKERQDYREISLVSHVGNVVLKAVAVTAVSSAGGRLLRVRRDKLDSNADLVRSLDFVVTVVVVRRLQEIVRTCLCVCVLFPFILDARRVDVPTGVTQEEGHTGFLTHLHSAVLALIFLA